MILDSSRNLMEGGWRNRIKGYTRRMLERAHLEMLVRKPVCISPLSPPTPTPKLSAEEIALQTERAEEERQREIFFNQIDYRVTNFDKTFWTIGADELIANPGRAGYAYNMGHFPEGGRRVIEARVYMDPQHRDESIQIAQIDMARKLLNAGASHGANYEFGYERGKIGNVLRMRAVPVCLDHGM